MPKSDGAVSLDILGNTRPFEASLNSLNGMVSKLGKQLKAAVGVTALGAFTKSCLDAASAAQQTANRVAIVFPTMAQQVEDFAATATQSMGMGAGAAKNLTAKFGMMAQGMGISEKASVGMAETMTQLAGDMAAFYGITTDEAASKLQGVFTGMTRGMKQLGVNMSQANLEAFALRNGITQSVSSMNEADLAALRLMYAQAQLARTSGYAARNMGTWAGQSNLLQQNFARLRATLGKALIAALLPALKVINMIISGIVTLANAFITAIEKITGKKIASLMGNVAGSAADVSIGADDASESLDGLTGSSGKAAKAAKAQNKAQKELNRTLAGFDKINKLTKQQQQKTPSASGGGGGGGIGGGGGVGGGGGGLAEGFADANKQFNKLKEFKLPPALVKSLAKLVAAFQRFVGIVKGAVAWVYNNILKPLGKWTLEKLAPRLVEILANALQVLCDILEALKPAFQWLWEHFFKRLAEFAGDAIITILDGIAGALQLIHDFAAKHPKMFAAIIAGLAGFLIVLKLGGVAGIVIKIGTALGVLFRTLMAANPIGLIITAIVVAIGLLYKNWDKIKKTKFGKAVTAIAKVVKKLASILIDKLGKAFEKIIGFVKNVVKLFAGSFKEKIEAAKAIVEGFRQAWEAIKSKAVELIAEAKEKVAGAIEALKGAWDTIKDKTAELIAEAKEKVAGAISKLKDAWDSVKSRAAELVADAKEKTAGALATIKAGWDAVKDKVVELGAKAATTVSEVKQWWSERLSEWKDKAAELGAKLKDGLAELVTNWKNNGLWKWWVGKNAQLGAKLREKLGQIVSNWKSKGLWKWWVGKSATLGAHLAKNLSKKVKGWRDAFHKWWTGKTATLSLKLSAAAQNMKSWINDNVIAKIEGALRRIPLLGKHIYLPRLAKGGYISRNTPTLAMVGDNRREGEIVAPESKLAAMAREAAAAGNGQEQVVAVLMQILQAVRNSNGDIYLDGQLITRNVVRNINRQAQQNGRSPLLV